MTTTTYLTITVPGRPRTQGSMMRMPNGGLKYPTGVLDHRTLVVTTLARAWEPRPPLTSPVLLRVRFHLPRPADHYLPANGKRPDPVLRDDAPTWHTKTGDLDKMVRLVGDALTLAGIVTDDAQVVAIDATKRWDTTGHTEVQVCPAP